MDVVVDVLAGDGRGNRVRVLRVLNDALVPKLAGLGRKLSLLVLEAAMLVDLVLYGQGVVHVLLRQGFGVVDGLD